ncbi:TIM barrel protein [Luteitalea sp.]|uniref:sugar phosphate isomerase/epimerase family protein n=1 Tax=Luteitalea sp. TaxID=2004800 RepID=UPI000AED58BA|nr:TIM barrel protein [Luteitalea sp.]
MQRRDFLSRAVALGAATLPSAAHAQAPAPPPVRRAEPSPAPAGLPLAVRVGMTDWNLGKRGDITKIALARELGLDGIQVSLTFPTDGSPHLRQPATQVAFKQQALEHGVQICSLAIGNPGKTRLPFHTNPASAILLVEAVEVARNLGTTNILLPILGDSHIDMASQAQVDTFVAMMKEVARYAEQAGVVIALEDWISAEDNLRLLDAIGSPAIGVYYDARNIKAKVHDPYGEPAKLGARIDQIRQERPAVDAGSRATRLAAPGAGVRGHRLSGVVRPRDRVAHRRLRGRHEGQHRVRAPDVPHAGTATLGLAPSGAILRN